MDTEAIIALMTELPDDVLGRISAIELDPELTAATKRLRIEALLLARGSTATEAAAIATFCAEVPFTVGATPAA